jgi:hypothetical protein
MIIEFPKKYTVACVGRWFEISIPTEFVAPLTSALMRQTWLSHVFGPDPANPNIKCVASDAYDVSIKQAHDALCCLCEHVMSPPVEVDMAVWGEALGGTESDASALAD